MLKVNSEVIEMTDYTMYNANNVLQKLEELIVKGRAVKIRDVCDELSIFDWWDETLTISRMKQMRTFLKNAIRLGFTGYVCFKVGASGCANGMWAHKESSTDGYSPDGDVLYRSFTPDYTYWSAQINGKWIPCIDGEAYNSCKTVKELEKLLEKDSLELEKLLEKGSLI